ncbi:translocon outer complex protein 120 [Actinidia rufa]|uniref:Translocon outer complex protein 120 n=1 Tax=Actinidia rufa TaxID=165716 RepID=A0A7J0D8Z8_9ERIC|nr:translocon outer complex protein 120 [Actinidia rufa]
MENGLWVGVLDGSHFGEKLTENEVLGSKVEEMDEVESDESKNSEGKEIFEEAIGADTFRGGDSQQEVDSIGESLHQSGKSEEVKPTMDLFDTGHQDYKSCEHEDIVASELHTDNVEGAKDNLFNLDTELKDDEIKELKEEAPDERSCELEYTSAATDSDHHGISLKPEDTQHMPLEGSKATPEVEKFSCSEASVWDTSEKIQASATKKIEGAQLQQADKDAKASNVAAKKLENKGAKEEEVKRSTHGNRQWETKPAATVSTSSAKSCNSYPCNCSRKTNPLRTQQMENPRKHDETHEKLQMIRVKFLRLAHSFDRVSARAEQLEAAGQELIDFSSTIMVLGKTGDRLDMQGRDFGDMLLLRTITEIFWPSIWFNAIVVLTHAASAPPEGPNGTTTSYDMFVTQRSHVVLASNSAGGWGHAFYESCFFSGESLSLQNEQGWSESITQWPATVRTWKKKVAMQHLFRFPYGIWPYLHLLILIIQLIVSVISILPTSGLGRPVLDTHGWDHEVDYEGVNVETLFVVKQVIPVSLSCQLTKDKKDANLQMEMASSVKHGEVRAKQLL